MPSFLGKDHGFGAASITLLIGILLRPPPNLLMSGSNHAALTIAQRQP
jgi:hypothetical protein